MLLFKRKKKSHGSRTTALIISNEKMEDRMEIVKSLEESGLLLQGVSETIKNETNEQEEEFLSMLLGAFTTTILGNALQGQGVMRAAEGTIRASESF